MWCAPLGTISQMCGTRAATSLTAGSEKSRPASVAGGDWGQGPPRLAGGRAVEMLACSPSALVIFVFGGELSLSIAQNTACYWNTTSLNILKIIFSLVLTWPWL